MNKIYQHIKLELHDHCINIVFNRPKKKNALHPDMIKEIIEILRLYENNSQIRIVLFSSNSDVFCAGADLKYLEKIKDFSDAENLEDSKQLMNLFKIMLSYPKLIISKVEGAAIAGGCGLVTASDIVFATHESVFGYPEVKIGFIPALVSTFLIKKIKPTDARELLLTGKLINAKKAQEIGLINYIDATNEIDQNINEFMSKIIKSTSANSINETKKMLYTWLKIDDDLKKAAEFNAKNRKTKDFEIGISSFLNKKHIHWDN